MVVSQPVMVWFSHPVLSVMRPFYPPGWSRVESVGWNQEVQGSVSGFTWILHNHLVKLMFIQIIQIFTTKRLIIFMKTEVWHYWQ